MKLNSTTLLPQFFYYSASGWIEGASSPVLLSQHCKLACCFPEIKELPYCRHFLPSCWEKKYFIFHCLHQTASLMPIQALKERGFHDTAGTVELQQTSDPFMLRWVARYIYKVKKLLKILVITPTHDIFVGLAGYCWMKLIGVVMPFKLPVITLRGQ